MVAPSKVVYLLEAALYFDYVCKSKCIFGVELQWNSQDNNLISMPESSSA